MGGYTPPVIVYNEVVSINFISIAGKFGSVYVLSAVVLSIVMIAIPIILRTALTKARKSRLNRPDPTEVQRSQTPCTLQSMTDVYLPQIIKDFPQFDCQLYRNKADSLLRSYFTAIEMMKSSELKEECSQTLRNKVDVIIKDLKARDVIQFFHSTEIHDVQIANYIKTGSTATVIFQLSVGQYAYTQNGFGKVVGGNKNLKHQTVYEVGLTYVQSIDDADGKSVLGVVCPNCGAPVRNLGSKFCEYCGSGIAEVNKRVWEFDSVNELTAYRI